MIEITFLGTTAGVPTIKRGHPAIALKYNGEIILFDFGENTQRQMMIASLSPMKISHIFLTHWHADHFAGLFGLIQTLSLKGRTRPLYIYGPKQTKKFMKTMIENIGYFNLTYNVIVKDVGKGVALRTKNYEIHTLPVKHGIPALAYKFVEADKPGKFNVKKAKQIGLKEVQFGILQKGKNVKLKNRTVKPDDVMGPKKKGITITYSGDTCPVKSMVKFAKDSDLLIHEATFLEEMQNHAESVYHTTTKQAAKVAKDAKVKQLVLTHISGRYKEATSLLSEAKKVFKKTKIAKDFMQIKLQR